MIPISVLRQSVRSIVRDPIFAVVVIVVLALGIAANTTIFTLIDRIFFTRLPYREPDRLAMVWEANPAFGAPAGSRVPVAWKNFESWIKQSHSFTAMEAFEQTGLNLTGLENPEHLIAARATPGFFHMLGVNAARGRTFLPGDNIPGADRVVLITNKFANLHFAAQEPLGRTLLLDAVPYSVIGVLPGEFRLPVLFQGVLEYKPDVWIPMPVVTINDPPGVTRARRLFVCARLNPDASAATARIEMTNISARLAQEDPTLNSGYSVNVFPLDIEGTDPGLRRAFYILWAAAFAVLLLACANLAGLMLVRAAGRQRDLAIMAALGAGRIAVMRKIVIEGLILALMGAGFGFMAAYAGVRLIVFLKPSDIHALDQIAINLHSLLFTALLSILTVLIFGLLPAWIVTNRNLMDVLKRTPGTGTKSKAGTVGRHTLVAGEIAIALTLSIASMLLIRSFQRLINVDPGFRAQHILTAHVSLAQPRYKDAADRVRFCEQLRERLRVLPGVAAVSFVDNMPLYAIRYASFEIEGRPVPRPDLAPTADYAYVTPGLFEAMGTPLHRGRLFSDQDAQEGSDNVAILNESLARQYWPNLDPIGSHIRSIASHRPPGPWRTVVGIIDDFHQFNLETPARPELFWPARGFAQMSVVVRTTVEPLSLSPLIQKTLWEIDKDQPIADVQTLEQIVQNSVSQRRFNTSFLSVFAGLSLILALVGVYGLSRYLVSSRTREIAIRFALGAPRKRVFRVLLLQPVPFVLAGLFLGLLFSFLLRRLTAGLLFKTSPLDVPTYIALPFIFLALVLLAGLFSARKAAGIDPATILRQD